NVNATDPNRPFRSPLITSKPCTLDKERLFQGFAKPEWQPSWRLCSCRLACGSGDGFGRRGREVDSERAQDLLIDAGYREKGFVGRLAPRFQTTERTQQRSPGDGSDSGDVVERRSELPRLAEPFARPIGKAMGFIPRSSEEEEGRAVGLERDAV